MSCADGIAGDSCEALDIYTAGLNRAWNEATHQYVPDFIVVLATHPADPDAPRLNLVLDGQRAMWTRCAP